MGNAESQEKFLPPAETEPEEKTLSLVRDFLRWSKIIDETNFSKEAAAYASRKNIKIGADENETSTLLNEALSKLKANKEISVETVPDFSGKLQTQLRHNNLPVLSEKESSIKSSSPDNIKNQTAAENPDFKFESLDVQKAIIDSLARIGEGDYASIADHVYDSLNVPQNSRGLVGRAIVDSLDVLSRNGLVEEAVQSVVRSGDDMVSAWRLNEKTANSSAGTDNDMIASPESAPSEIIKAEKSVQPVEEAPPEVQASTIVMGSETLPGKTPGGPTLEELQERNISEKVLDDPAFLHRNHLEETVTNKNFGPGGETPEEYAARPDVTGELDTPAFMRKMSPNDLADFRRRLETSPVVEDEAPPEARTSQSSDIIDFPAFMRKMSPDKLDEFQEELRRVHSAEGEPSLRGKNESLESLEDISFEKLLQVLRLTRNINTEEMLQKTALANIELIKGKLGAYLRDEVSGEVPDDQRLGHLEYLMATALTKLDLLRITDGATEEDVNKARDEVVKRASELSLEGVEINPDTFLKEKISASSAVNNATRMEKEPEVTATVPFRTAGAYNPSGAYNTNNLSRQKAYQAYAEATKETQAATRPPEPLIIHEHIDEVSPDKDYQLYIKALESIGRISGVNSSERNALYEKLEEQRISLVSRELQSELKERFGELIAKNLEFLNPKDYEELFATPSIRGGEDVLDLVAKIALAHTQSKIYNLQGDKSLGKALEEQIKSLESILRGRIDIGEKPEFSRFQESRKQGAETELSSAVPVVESAIASTIPKIPVTEGILKEKRNALAEAETDFLLLSDEERKIAENLKKNRAILIGSVLSNYLANENSQGRENAIAELRIRGLKEKTAGTFLDLETKRMAYNDAWKEFRSQKTETESVAETNPKTKSETSPETEPEKNKKPKRPEHPVIEKAETKKKPEPLVLNAESKSFAKKFLEKITLKNVREGVANRLSVWAGDKLAGLVQKRISEMESKKTRTLEEIKSAEAKAVEIRQELADFESILKSRGETLSFSKRSAAEAEATDYLKLAQKKKADLENVSIRIDAANREMKDHQKFASEAEERIDAKLNVKESVNNQTLNQFREMRAKNEACRESCEAKRGSLQADIEDLRTFKNKTVSDILRKEAENEIRERESRYTDLSDVLKGLEKQAIRINKKITRTESKNTDLQIKRKKIGVDTPPSKVENNQEPSSRRKPKQSQSESDESKKSNKPPMNFEKPQTVENKPEESPAEKS